jgi:two-component system chemotaxis response regulator CheY
VGLARAGGPDDAALRELSLGSREPAWFRRVIEERRPVRAAPSDNGDHRLAVLLGNEIPGEVYVAPIVTGDRVAALLYADNLPAQEPIGDTSALEVLSALLPRGDSLGGTPGARGLTRACDERREVGVGSQEPRPLCRFPAHRSASRSRSRGEGFVRRILVVEDSGAMRALIGAALEGLDEKLEIDEAESGFAALRLLPRQVYDLIVTDINMPDINGLELVSFVKRDPRYRRTPLVIVSTEGSERDRAKGLALGADAYLVKPFEAGELQRLVLDLLPNRRS